jgi:hypothetical protein
MRGLKKQCSDFVIFFRGREEDDKGRVISGEYLDIIDIISIMPIQPFLLIIKIHLKEERYHS